MAERQKNFSCPACGAEFDTKEQLEEHGREEHEQSGLPGGSSDGSQGSSSTKKK